MSDTHRRHLLRTFAVLALLLLSAGAAAAQTISGVVADTSGAVLPGVTVEAQNAATQQVRTVTTDGAGRYVVANLQPGDYSVRYTLAGFASATRPGITLTSGFTATVDMQLTIGTQSDTITVTADAPLVDVQSSAAPQTMNREVLDTIPSGRSPVTRAPSRANDSVSIPAPPSK